MGRTPLNAILITRAAQSLSGTSPSNIGQEEYYDVGSYGEFTAFLTVHQAPNGTAEGFPPFYPPSLDVRIEQSADHSPDVLAGNPVGWTTLVNFAQFTATPGTYAVSVPGPGNSDAKTFARYIRFMQTMHGLNTIYTVTLRLSPKE